MKPYLYLKAIIMEIGRVANRQEVTIEMLDKANVPAAAVVEAPITGRGNNCSLATFFCYNVLGASRSMERARLLLADEVGVGKTLSWQLVPCERPARRWSSSVLVPSSLRIQWQIEMKDKLGIPSAVWCSQQKGVARCGWSDLVTTWRMPLSIGRCPIRLALFQPGS